MRKGDPVMSKDIRTSAEIGAWITQRLRTLEDCGECKVTAVQRLRDPDDEGCNWSDVIFVRTGGVTREYFEPFLREVILEARQRFNLPEEE